MLNIILSGCNGRMGQVVSKLALEDENTKIAAGFDVNAVKNFDYPVYADPLEFGGSADVIIDFSNPAALDGLLSFALDKKIPLVICTTGHSDTQLKKLDEASKNIAVFKSGNMSLGISLLSDLIKRAALVLGGGFDVEIIEKHHNQKIDAPSGTALMLYDAVKSALLYETKPVYDRHEVRQKRGKTEVGIHTVRGGTIVGEHEVLFAGHHEVIEIKHSALSREVFAAGAMKAAYFMKGRAPGMYDMNDVVAAV